MNYLVWKESENSENALYQFPEPKRTCSYWLFFLQLILQNLKMIHFTQAKADDHWKR